MSSTRHQGADLITFTDSESDSGDESRDQVFKSTTTTACHKDTATDAGTTLEEAKKVKKPKVFTHTRLIRERSTLRKEQAEFACQRAEFDADKEELLSEFEKLKTEADVEIGKGKVANQKKADELATREFELQSFAKGLFETVNAFFETGFPVEDDEED